MTNVIWDGTAAPAAKQNLASRPRINALTQFGKEDWEDIRTLWTDTSTVLNAGIDHIFRYGVKNDGTDAAGANTAAFQNMLATAPIGRAIWMPRGQYRLSSTTTRTRPGLVLIGEQGIRMNPGGTEIIYSGTGPCLQFGTDSGNPWTTGEYDGPQNHQLTNIAFTHVAPDTALRSIDGVTPVYKAGSTAIWDWRGGSVVLDRCTLANFETIFAGIQSDFSRIIDCIISNSKYGLYFGPRSDQCYVEKLNAFFCDRAVTLDLSTQTVIDKCSFAFTGHDTCAGIEVRRGTSSPVIQNCWFEKSGINFSSSIDSLSLISVGEVDGYGGTGGANGSIQSPGASPNTSSVNGCSIINPLTYTTLPGPYHTKYLVTLDDVRGLHLVNPTAYRGGSIDNFDSLVGIQSGHAVDATECVFDVLGMRDQAFSKLLTHSGTGTPSYRFTVLTTPVKIYTPGSTEWHVAGSASSSFTVAAAGVIVPGTAQIDGNATIGATAAATHTMRGQITTVAPGGGTGIQTSNSVTGQTAGSVIWRLTSTGSYDTTAGAIFPVAMTISDTTTRSAGANSVGKTGVSIDCSTGTGVSATALTTARGVNDFNTGAGSTTYFRKSRKDLGKATTVIAANTNNLAGATDIMRWYLNPSGAFDLTGIVATEDGHKIRLYNISANTLALKHLVTSSAANQFIGLANADTALAPGTTRVIEYSTDSFTSGGKWVVLW